MKNGAWPRWMLHGMVLAVAVGLTGGVRLNGQEAVRFVAYTVRVPPPERDAYVEYLVANARPVWASLRRDGLLDRRTVLEQVSVATELEGVPPWNFLHLAQLTPGVDPEEFLAEERRRMEAAAFAPPGQLLRVETLESTPNSFHPTPARSDAGDLRLEHIIEYINVFDGHLDEYRRSMIVNSGPAIGRLVAQGLVYTFQALETESVEHLADGMPRWNQIHVMATVVGADFPPGAFDQALRAVNPEGGGYEGVFGRLDDIRNKPRETVNREVSELAVGPP